MAIASEAAEKTLTLTINGEEVKAAPGQTILQVAREVGIDIPTLCHDDRLEPYGACRICLVEVEGARGPMPACASVITNGMVINTHTEKINKLRKFVIELLLSNHPLDCPVCEAAGDCRLQDYAYEYEVNMVPWGWHPKNFDTKDDHPNVARNPNRCILCGRCVRICREVVGIGCWGFTYRGYETIVDTPYNLPLQEVGCVSCGQCISTCPVGALVGKRSRYAARQWQTDKTRTTCPYCGVGCELTVQTARGKYVRVTSPVGNGINNGNLCVKGRFGLDFVNSADRLNTPLMKDGSGNLAPTTWDAALDRIEQQFKKVKAEKPDSFAVLSSAKCSNEENYLMQKFARGVMGTNNVDHCARLCHSSTVAGLATAFGSGAMTNSIGDLAQADVIFVIGSNTTEGHPVIALEIIKALRQGKTLIVADPRKIDLARKAALHLQIHPGTNVALLKGMMRHIVDSGLEDKEFISERTENYDALVASLQDLTVEQAAEICGIDADELRKAAELYAKAGAANIIYAMGVTQHHTGTNNVLSIANLAMLTGNIGRPGTGVNALRGQSNVQGACDMGGLPNVFSGYQPIDDDAAVAKMESAWGVKLENRTPGKTLMEIVEGALTGDIKTLWIMGENPIISDPDQHHVEEAMQKVDFLVVQDIFLTDTAKYADVVLPACTSLEKDGTVTNTERRVQRLRKALEPLAGTIPDWQIIQTVANRMGADWSYGSPEEVMTEINQVTPSYAGITYERIEKLGLQWPCPDTEHPGTPILHGEQFTRGKGLFSVIDYIPADETPDEEYPLYLTTGRELVHYHTGTMTRQAPGLNALAPEGRVEISPEDAHALGIKDGERVRLSTRRGSIEPIALVTDRVSPGLVFMPFHYWETPANRLTNACLDPVCKIPEFKVAAAKVEKLA